MSSSSPEAGRSARAAAERDAWTAYEAEVEAAKEAINVERAATTVRREAEARVATTRVILEKAMAERNRFDLEN